MRSPSPTGRSALETGDAASKIGSLASKNKPFGRNARNSISLAPIMASIGNAISPIRGIRGEDDPAAASQSARFKTPRARRMTFVTETDEDNLMLPSTSLKYL